MIRSEYRYLNAAGGSRDVLMELMEARSTRLNQGHQQTKALMVQLHAHMKSDSYYSRLSDLWTYVHKVAGVLFSGQVIQTGLSLLAGEHIVKGGLLIAGGIVHVANTCFSDHGIWEWAAGKAHAGKEHLQLATLFSSVASGIAFFYSLYLQDAAQRRGKALELLFNAISSLDVVAQLGQGRTTYMRTEANREKRRIQAALSVLQHAHKIMQGLVMQAGKACQTNNHLSQQMLALVTRPKQ